jgi:hypothetical protein
MNLMVSPEKVREDTIFSVLVFWCFGVLVGWCFGGLVP